MSTRCPIGYCRASEVCPHVAKRLDPHQRSHAHKPEDCVTCLFRERNRLLYLLRRTYALVPPDRLDAVDEDVHATLSESVR